MKVSYNNPTFIPLKKDYNLDVYLLKRLSM